MPSDPPEFIAVDLSNLKKGFPAPQATSLPAQGRERSDGRTARTTRFCVRGGPGRGSWARPLPQTPCCPRQGRPSRARSNSCSRPGSHPRWLPSRNNGPPAWAVGFLPAIRIIAAMIKLFVGLGNPGSEYEATRHNAGFWWDAGARTQGVAATRAQLLGTLAARHGARPARVAAGNRRPHEPVGKSVAALARFFKIAPEEIWSHDELDIAPARPNSSGGSHAGTTACATSTHNWAHPDYWRLRIGIGHPGDKAEVANWVLKNRPPTSAHSSKTASPTA